MTGAVRALLVVSCTIFMTIETFYRALFAIIQSAESLVTSKFRGEALLFASAFCIFSPFRALISFEIEIMFI